MEQTLKDPLSAGYEALAQGAWEEAYACFAALLQDGETAEALEGLGIAAEWLNNTAVIFEARERAYRLYRERGDYRGAGRVAIYLALDYYSFRGEYAIANGWIQRAYRLLDRLDMAPEHGWLAVWDAHLTFEVHRDTVAVRRLSAQAITVAQTLDIIDLEMMALALEGLALVCEGDVAEGMRRLDEATTAAVAGEITDLDANVTTCCYLISACERVRDYDRAMQWCDKVMVVATRQVYPFMFSFCQTHYAGVLIWRGAWAEAEAILGVATEELIATRLAYAAEGVVRRAALCRLQGRYTEAAALLAQAESPPLRILGGRIALLGRSALALDQGDATAAADMADRFLRGLPVEERLERTAALEVLALAQIALGALGQAASTLLELRSIVAVVATGPLRAAVGFVEGAVTAAQGDHEQAHRWFEDAVDLYQRNGAPFETARARIELARSLLFLGRSQDARQQAVRALEVFQQLGASPEGNRAATLLQKIESTIKEHSLKTGDANTLTPREREVLGLIAAGKSNQEIATQLVMSVRTAERHISNIYGKIGTSGKVARAMATAYAIERGLTSPLQLK